MVPVRKVYPGSDRHHGKRRGVSIEWVGARGGRRVGMKAAALEDAWEVRGTA